MKELLSQFSEEMVLYVAADSVCLREEVSSGSSYGATLDDILKSLVGHCTGTTHHHPQTFSKRLLHSIGRGTCPRFKLTDTYSGLTMYQVLLDLLPQY